MRATMPQTVQNAREMRRNARRNLSLTAKVALATTRPSSSRRDIRSPFFASLAAWKMALQIRAYTTASP